MSCYKDLLCEVDELQAQLSEISLAVETLRDLAAQRGEIICTSHGMGAAKIRGLVWIFQDGASFCRYDASFMKICARSVL